MCYLNAAEGPLSHCPGQCTTGGLAMPNPPPPPLPFPSPLRLIFSLGAPLPMGGDSATVLGSVALAGGVLVASGGAESGVFGTTGNGPWCDFSGELTLPSAAAAARADDVGAHDLFISMHSTGGNRSLHRFALDYFSLRVTKAHSQQP